MSRLFLDDERNPSDVSWVTLPSGPWVTVRTQEEFEQYILCFGVPEFIAFDNDLGDGNGSGMECVVWLINAVLDKKVTIPDNFGWIVHSKNPIAASHISGTLTNFIRFLAEEKDA